MDSVMIPYLRRPQKSRYSVRPFYWTLLAFTALTLFSWATGRLRHAPSPSSLHPSPRDVGILAPNSELECRLVRNAKDQCSFVRSNCPDHADGLFSYLQFYYCTLAGAKPLAFIILVLWLALLFSTIGIAASDFLCINLSTLASILGLSESLTGVTFLAFGNGSPDVFSTFAAMRSNSGSLAIGELLGAASFITLVVAGSMAIVRPFKVARRSFVRDVGYFIIAVGFSMTLLVDGRLFVWESATMVGLYCFYVVLVVTWHWYLVRKRRAYERNKAARSHFHIPQNQYLDIQEEVEDDDPRVAGESTGLLHGASTEDFDALENAGVPAWKDGDEDDETRNRYLAEISNNMHVFRPTARRRNTLNPIRASLVGAVEFQSVLSSLQKSRNTHRAMSINLDRYSDSQDNLSVASHPRTRQPSGSGLLSPHSAGSARARAVSASDAARLKLDTSVLDPNQSQPLLKITRPSVNESRAPSQVAQTDADAVTSSPPPGDQPRNPSPDLLAPPDPFHAPNYQAESPVSRSPLDVSPRGTTYVTPDGPLESPSIPFPLLDIVSSPSFGAPSIRFPPTPSPAERLQVHDDIYDGESRRSSSTAQWSFFQRFSPLQPLITILFPTLIGWKTKNFWARLLGIITAPSVLLLTVTLPVVDPVQPEEDPIPVILTSADGEDAPTPHIRLPEDSPVMRAHGYGSTADRTIEQRGKAQSMGERRRTRWDSELPAVELRHDSSAPPPKEWCQWLVSIQLFAGPFFIALTAWTAMDPDLKGHNLLLPSLLSLLFSLVCLTCLVVGTRHTHNSQPPNQWRPFLALLGFGVAICWIATIATEVVNLLKTMGVILNISDSLLGLTVFAVGNSLGDLVANTTVARLGYPVMALSACFGGPMLNILLGIGLGGLYMTLHVSPETAATLPRSYDLAISKVLLVNGVTLLTTLVLLLVIVPLNNWRMDRKIGWGLVILWSITTLGNVILEIIVE